MVTRFHFGAFTFPRLHFLHGPSVSSRALAYFYISCTALGGIRFSTVRIRRSDMAHGCFGAKRYRDSPHMSHSMAVELLPINKFNGCCNSSGASSMRSISGIRSRFLLDEEEDRHRSDTIYSMLSDKSTLLLTVYSGDFNLNAVPTR